MDYSENTLCGVGELELDPDIVSEEAGKLYSELQVTHQECIFVYNNQSNISKPKKKATYANILYRCIEVQKLTFRGEVKQSICHKNCFSCVCSCPLR